MAVIAAQVFRSPRELLDEQDMTASEVLRGMIQKYQQATSYSDQGVIRVTQISAEQQVQQSAPFAVQFERSGRLRVRAYEILLASDGKRLRARYMDPSVTDLSRQTLWICQCYSSTTFCGSIWTVAWAFSPYHFVCY